MTVHGLDTAGRGWSECQFRGRSSLLGSHGADRTNSCDRRDTAVSVRESGVRRRVDKAAEWRTGSRPKCASAGNPYKFRVPAQAVKSQFR